MADKKLSPDEIAANRHTLRFLKSWLKVKGLKQRDLAEHLDMSEPSISKWLNGKAPMTMSQFARVAELLGAKPEDLLFSPEDAEKSERFKAASELANELDDEAFAAWILAGRAMRKK